jgi:hypothetical protein
MSYINRREIFYKGTPLPRDSVTPLKPLWEMNHPVACKKIVLSIEPGQEKKIRI